MILYKNKKLVIPAGLSPNINHQSVEIKNQNKYVSITENGTEIVTFDPENYTGLGIVQINTEVAAASIQPPVTVELTDNGRYSVTPQEGYVGLGEVDVRVDVQPKLQLKVVDSSTNPQVILPDETYAGMAQISINPYTLDEKTVDSSTRLQVITSDVNGISQVTINPYILNSLEVDSSTGTQELRGQFGTVTVNPYTLDSSSVVYTENGEYSVESTADGLSRVDVSVNIDTQSYYDSGYSDGETAGIAEQKALLDSSTFTSNGTYTRENGWNEVTINVGEVNNQALTLDASINQQILTPSAPYTGFSPVTVNAVTAAIDSNIVAGNIKKDVSILGVTGTYEGSGAGTPGKPYIQADGTYGSEINLGISVPSTGYSDDDDVYVDCVFSVGSGASYPAFSATSPMTTTKCIVGIGGYYNRQIAYGLGLGRLSAGTGSEQLYYLFGQPSTSTSYYNVGLTAGDERVYHTNVFMNDEDNEAQVQICTYVVNRFSGFNVAFSRDWFSCGNVQNNAGDWSVFSWEDDDETYGPAPSGTRIFELHVRALGVIYDFYPVYADGKAGLAKYTNGVFTTNLFGFMPSSLTYGVQV